MTRILLLLLMSLPALATDYYVSNVRSVNGSGTEASPWKDATDINWTTVGTSLASGSVNVYMDTRQVWTQSSSIRPASGDFVVGHLLRIVMDEKYTLDATGTATWLPETTGRCGILTNNTGSQVGGFTCPTNTTNVTISGAIIYRPYAGFQADGSIANPTLGVNHITISNCTVIGDTNITSYGIAFVFAEAGCYQFKVSHCRVTNVLLEAMYLGHYNYLTPSITNNVFEYCTNIDTGLYVTGEGEIDVKPGCADTVVRYCEAYRTPGRTNGSQTGVVMAANNSQIYGCNFHNLRIKASDDDFGYGVYLNSDGGDGTGQLITNALVYNNLFYSNQGAGIRVVGTLSNLTGVKVLNNTFAYNGRYGLETRSGNSKSVVVSQLTNNIFLENTTADISLQNSDCSLTAANNNLVYRASGNPFDYQGTGKSWAQWQGLGYDSAGVNADPVLASDFSLGSGSPAIAAGANLSAIFTVDMFQAIRGAPWDIGACKYSLGSGGSIGSVGLKGFKGL